MEKVLEIINMTLFEYKGFQLNVFNILILTLVVIGAKFFLKGARVFLHRQFLKKNLIDEGKEYTINQLIGYIVWTLVVFVCINTLGIDISILLGASAALLVGVGLGLQDVFRDFISGIVLLFEGIFKVGDLIDFEGNVAQVKQIDLRTSKVETRDGTIIIVPNSRLVSSHIVNWTLNGRATRFCVEVGVAYGSDTEKVKEILENVAKAHPLVVRQRDILVRFQDFGDSALHFSLFFWSGNPWQIEVTKSDIRFAIDKAFREEGITIPFPQRDLHIRGNEGVKLQD